MPVRGLVRTAAFKGTVTDTNAPIYVDSDDNIPYLIPAGTGSSVTGASKAGSGSKEEKLGYNGSHEFE